MATHDYVIDNSTGANVRADINSVLQAILTNNSSSSAPSTTAAYMWWADTTSGTLKIRNSSDNAWVELLQLDGTLTLEDGSASTPGLAFRDDLNTGIFSGSADEFNIATGGTERFVITSAGRCGIGTTGPNELLEVAGSCRLSSGGATRTLHMGPASSGIEYNVNGTTFIQGRTDAYPLAFKTQSLERMRIDSSGRLLIGSSSHVDNGGIEAHLQVLGTGTDDTSIILSRYSNDSSSPFLVFSKSRNGSIGGNTVVQDNDRIGRIKFFGNDGTDGSTPAAEIDVEVDGTPGSNDMPGRIVFKTTADGASNTTERMRIRSGGEVAIGGTGFSGQPFSVQTSGNNVGYMQSTGTTRSVMFFVDGNSSVNVGFGAVGNSHVFLKDGTEKMRIDSSGNLVLGSSTASGALTVVSTKNAESGRSDASNYHLHLRNNENDNGEAIGISFGITSSSTGVGASILHERDSSGSQGSLQFYTNGDGSNVAERMRIDSSGNVGIGTSTIGNKLQVHEGGSFGSFAGFSNDTTGSSSSDGLIVGIDSNEEGVLYHYENKAIRFGTNNSEKMRLTNVGQLLVGTTDNNSCSAKLIVQADSIPSYYANSGGLNVNVTNSNDIHCAEFFQGRYNKRVITHSHSNTGSVTFDVFEQNDSNVGSITGGGSSIAFNTSSDYRLKENIVNITDGITRLKQLIPRRFNWISDSTNTLVDGFIAHEVSPVIPEAVTGEKDALEEDGSIDPQAMDYSKLTPLLTAALQEAIAKIEVLETKVAALEAA